MNRGLHAMQYTQARQIVAVRLHRRTLLRAELCGGDGIVAISALRMLAIIRAGVPLVTFCVRLT
ncbi:hypothetical protein A3754_07585 [Alcanivorax sp. HI0083]|nr:hypothetical protein A3754_07585 [Alcanivorax sp. HI0083]